MPAGLRAAALGGLLSAIVTITAGRASAEACKGAPDSLGNYFESAPGDAAVLDEPFLDGDGNERTLADDRGHGLVVNFWATWCAPCVEEMPALDRLSAELDGAGIRILALSEDFKGAAAVRQFFDRNGIDNLDVLVDKRGRLVKTLGIPGLPTTVLIDGDGREVGRVIGVAAWDDPASVRFLRDCLGG